MKKGEKQSIICNKFWIFNKVLVFYSGGSGLDFMVFMLMGWIDLMVWKIFTLKPFKEMTHLLIARKINPKMPSYQGK